MADTEVVQDIDAVVNMLGDELDLEADTLNTQQTLIAINQALMAITPKIRVIHGDDY